MIPVKFDHIYNQDCIEGMKNLIPDSSIDIIIADPPYNLSKGKTQKYSFDHSKDRNTQNPVSTTGSRKGTSTPLIVPATTEWDTFTYSEYIDFSVAWLTEAYRVLKPTGSMWIFGTYHNMGVINVVLHQLEYNFINEVIWYKRNATPNLTCRQLTASHENLYWVSKNSKDYFFDYKMSKEGDYPEDSFKNDGKQMRTVWDIPQAKKAEEIKYGRHQTQKPLAVITRMLQVSSQAGMVMMTPFAGSGSECVAAKNLGLHFIGFEVAPEYVDLANKRLYN